MKENTLNSLALASDQGVREPLDSLARFVGSLRRIKGKQAGLTQQRKDIETVLRAALLGAGASIGTVNGVPVVSYASSTRIALDQARLKRERPDVVEEFSDISEVWTFRLLTA